MTQSSASKSTIAGVLIAFVGVVVAIVFALQAWRSCPEDDVAAGCSVLPQDFAGMMVGIVLVLLGLVVLWFGALRRSRTKTAGLAPKGTR